MGELFKIGLVKKPDFDCADKIQSWYPFFTVIKRGSRKTGITDFKGQIIYSNKRMKGKLLFEAFYVSKENVRGYLVKTPFTDMRFTLEDIPKACKVVYYVNDGEDDLVNDH